MCVCQGVPVRTPQGFPMGNNNSGNTVAKGHNLPVFLEKNAMAYIFSEPPTTLLILGTH